jgi:hypothetical protein
MEFSYSMVDKRLEFGSSRCLSKTTKRRFMKHEIGGI